eukprot:7321846-Prymnesium_polylepis.1
MSRQRGARGVRPSGAARRTVDLDRAIKRSIKQSDNQAIREGRTVDLDRARHDRPPDNVAAGAPHLPCARRAA